MPINSEGLTINEKGNILCKKIGTKKENYMSPLCVNNSEYMRINGWEPIRQPEAPPKLNGKSNLTEFGENEKPLDVIIPEPAKINSVELNLITEPVESKTEVKKKRGRPRVKK